MKRQQDGQRYLHVETISQIWAMGDPAAHCPPDEMSDDRPTAAHVHTKGDPMDHTAGLGRGTLAGSRMHASFLLQNDCDLVPVQPRPRPAPVGHNKRELPARCLSHMPGRQGRQGYLRTENILVLFDSRAFPASRAPLPLASALPGLLFTSSPLEFGSRRRLQSESVFQRPMPIKRALSTSVAFAIYYIHWLARYIKRCTHGLSC